MAKEIKVWPSWAFHFATYTGLRKPVTDQHATRERGPFNNGNFNVLPTASRCSI